MKKGDVLEALGKGASATVRASWRGTRLSAAWVRRKAVKMDMERRISDKEDRKRDFLLRIGATVCAGHQASPLQDDELAPLCHEVAALDAEVKNLKQTLAQMLAEPLLAEDKAAEPLGKGAA